MKRGKYFLVVTILRSDNIKIVIGDAKINDDKVLSP